MKFRKLSALLLLTTLTIQPSANARTLIPVYDAKTKVVLDHRGNCVRTKWLSQQCCDICGFPPPPQPAAPVTVEKQKTTQFVDLIRQSVYFKIDKDNLDATDEQRMNDVINEIAKGGAIQDVKMVGYADRFASTEYNKALSKRRAMNVLNYFRNKGLFNNVQVGFGFFGKDRPVTNCPTNVKLAEQIACLQADRRVDIEVEIVREHVETTTQTVAPAYPRPATSAVEVYSRPVNPAIIKQLDAPAAVPVQPVIQAPLAQPAPAPVPLAPAQLMAPQPHPTPMQQAPEQPAQAPQPVYQNNYPTVNSIDSLKPQQ